MSLQTKSSPILKEIASHFEKQEVEEYPILLWKRDPLFVGVIKELSIMESAQDLKTLYEKIEARKNQVLLAFQEAHLDHLLKPKEQKKEKKSLWVYFLTLIIVMTFLTAPLLSMAKPIASFATKFTNLFADVTEMPLSQHIIVLNHKLQSMPEERKAEVQEALRSIVKQLRPYIKELKEQEE